MNTVMLPTGQTVDLWSESRMMVDPDTRRSFDPLRWDLPFLGHCERQSPTLPNAMTNCSTSRIAAGVAETFCARPDVCVCVPVQLDLSSVFIQWWTLSERFPNVAFSGLCRGKLIIQDRP